MKLQARTGNQVFDQDKRELSGRWVRERGVLAESMSVRVQQVSELATSVSSSSNQGESAPGRVQVMAATRWA